MTAIIIPGRRCAHPQGRVKVDVANHAGANALTAMTFQGVIFDAAANAPASYFAGQPVYGAGPTGYGLLATGGYRLRLQNNPIYLQKQEVTYYAVLQSIGGGNNGDVFSRGMGSSVASVSIGVHKGSLNGWRAAVNGTTSDFLASPLANIGAADASVPATLVLTVGGGVARLYVNGRLAGSGNYGGDIDYSRTDQGLVIFSSGDVVSNFRGLLYSAGVIDGVMSPEAAEDFSQNPWQLFKSEPSRIYSFPSEIKVSVRSIILEAGALTVLPIGQEGTGKKPIVLLDGNLKERVGSEGIPVVLENGDLRTVEPHETLVI